MCMNKKLLFSFFMALSFAEPGSSDSFIDAAKVGNLTEMELLITDCFSVTYKASSLFASNPLDVQDIAGNTPLHHAVLNQDYEMFQMLVKNGASLSVRNKDDKCPFNLALELKSEDMIEAVGVAMAAVLFAQDQAWETKQGYLKVIGGIWGVLLLMGVLLGIAAV